MTLTAQIIGIFAMAANVAAYQFKNKRNVILCQLAGSALFAVNMFMLDALMGGLLNVVGIVRAIVYINKDRLKIPVKLVNGIFMALYLASYILVFAVFGKEPTSFNLLIEILPLIGMGVMTVGLSMKDSKAIRVCGFINSPCWLIYNSLVFSLGGILCEVFGIVSAISAYIRLDMKNLYSNKGYRRDIMPILTYDNKNFLMDGKPYQIISGAIHYFRVVPEYWEDRLKKLKACGFNTVETYTCWNLHERKEGEFDFSGILDIERFIETAEKLELNVIIRPGPYICAEWELGGLPSWLLKYPDIALRCDDERYLEKVKPFYRELFNRIRPHLCTNGGRIIMVQVENEYGSYGDDKTYLRKVAALYRENGIDCLQFTSDGTNPAMLGGGTLPELLAVANFGSAPIEKLGKLRDFKPNQPLMCGEFWCGWFNHWYEENHVHKPAEVAAMLDEFFDIGASFNFYMFHGGTNFSFWNGANHMNDMYQPTITSYDYCAPLSEAGDMTVTFDAVRETIAKRTGKEPSKMNVKNTEKAAYGRVELTEKACLFENLNNLATPVHHAYPQTMEQLGQDFGYIVYSTVIEGPIEPQELVFTHLHDRAHIFLDGKLAGVRERSRRMDSVTISLQKGESVRLDVLVENMGRVNYGPKLFDQKGLVGGVRIGQRYHFGWEHSCLPMEDLSSICWEKAEPCDMPAFYKGSLNIEGTPCDTFVKLDNFKKGICIVNGFNIGRYYNAAGPQKTLYVPAPLLKSGENEIIVFETDGCITPNIEFLDTPELG